MLTFSHTAEGITPEQLRGFFVGWPQPPSPETHVALLRGSDHVVLALDKGRVVGFITALSDGVLYTYISLLEVLPEHQGRGTGSELVRRLLGSLAGLYPIDVLCDPALQPFYARLGLRPATGMMLRRYDRQARWPLPGK